MILSSAQAVRRVVYTSCRVRSFGPVWLMTVLFATMPLSFGAGLDQAEFQSQIAHTRYRTVDDLFKAACTPCHNQDSYPQQARGFRFTDAASKVEYMRASMDYLSMPPDPLLREFYQAKPRALLQPEASPRQPGRETRP